MRRKREQKSLIGSVCAQASWMWGMIFGKSKKPKRGRGNARRSISEDAVLLEIQPIDAVQWAARPRSEPEELVIHPRQRIKEKKFTEIRKLVDHEQGKNNVACLVFSRSSRRPAAMKIWIYKPLIPLSKTNKYSLADATREVYFSLLDVALRNKSVTAKTKFNLEDRGVVSRIVGDDISKTRDINRYCFADGVNFPVPSSAQKSLLYSLVYGIVIGDRDIKPENLILKFSNTGEAMVYGIDHEFAGAKFKKATASLEELLSRLMEDPKNMARIFIDPNWKWNHKPYMDPEITENDIKWYGKLLFNFITWEMLQETLIQITQKIATNDFSACYAVKNKIHNKFKNNPGVYTAAEITQIILPTIDSIINAVKANVQIIQQFLAERTARPYVSLG